MLGLVLRTRSLSCWARYAVTTALVLVALVLRRVILGDQPGYAYLMFYPAILIAGIVFDRGSGLYAVMLSASLGTFFFTAPLKPLGIADERDAMGRIVFLLTAGLMTAALEGFHALVRRSAEAERELIRSVAALQAANARLLNAEKQAMALLGEAIHRFRNDLQRLNATIVMQKSATKESAVRAALSEVESRIAALGAIKARLDITQTLEAGKARVETSAFLSGLVEDWATMIELHPVSLQANAESHQLPTSRAVLLGLLLNELLSNAMKYAFPEDRAGQIRVAFSRDGDQYRMTVMDDGVGFDRSAPPKGTGLGQRIIRSLAQQLGGSLEINSREGGGTACVVSFPVECSSS
jgi:two-component sensor histidine kinase